MAIRIFVLYPNTPGSRFDADYYISRHTPFALDLLRPQGLTSIRTTVGTTALDGGEPPFWSSSEMEFTSRESFDLAMATCGAALFADMPNYTNAQPVLQLCELQPG